MDSDGQPEYRHYSGTHRLRHLFLADPEVKFYARVIPGAAVIGVFAIIILKIICRSLKE